MRYRYDPDPTNPDELADCTTFPGAETIGSPHASVRVILSPRISTFVDTRLDIDGPVAQSLTTSPAASGSFFPIVYGPGPFQPPMACASCPPARIPSIWLSRMVGLPLF